MKKGILLLITFSLFTFHAFAQEIEVPQTNQPLLTKRTASWCGNCGSWGWSLFEGLLQDNNNTALVIAAHHSGNYQNDIANSITNNFGGFGQPIFYLNNQNQGATNGNASTTRADIKGKVENFNAASPVAQTGIKAEVDGTYTIHVETNTRFFQEAGGNHYLGIYLVEKSFIGTQASIGSNAEHKNVLRLAADDEAFGTQFAFGTIEVDSEFAGNFTITQSMIENAGITNLDGLYNGGFMIASIIWKLNESNNSYEVINTNHVEVSVLTAATELGSVTSFKVFPTIIQSSGALEIELEEPLQSAQIVLYDQLGSYVKSIFSGDIPTGKHQFTIENNQLASGQYFIHLTTSEGSKVERVIFN